MIANVNHRMFYVEARQNVLIAQTTITFIHLNTRTAEGVIVTHFRIRSRFFLLKYRETLTKFLDFS